MNSRDPYCPNMSKVALYDSFFEDIQDSHIYLTQKLFFIKYSTTGKYYHPGFCDNPSTSNQLIHFFVKLINGKWTHTISSVLNLFFTSIFILRRLKVNHEWLYKVCKNIWFLRNISVLICRISPPPLTTIQNKRQSQVSLTNFERF